MNCFDLRLESHLGDSNSGPQLYESNVIYEIAFKAFAYAVICYGVTSTSGREKSADEYTKTQQKGDLHQGKHQNREKHKASAILDSGGGKRFEFHPAFRFDRLALNFATTGAAINAAAFRSLART